jgi:hypothetical protein
MTGGSSTVPSHPSQNNNRIEVTVTPECIFEQDVGEIMLNYTLRRAFLRQQLGNVRPAIL